MIDPNHLLTLTRYQSQTQPHRHSFNSNSLHNISKSVSTSTNRRDQFHRSLSLGRDNLIHPTDSWKHKCRSFRNLNISASSSYELSEEEKKVKFYSSNYFIVLFIFL